MLLYWKPWSSCANLHAAASGVGPGEAPGEEYPNPAGQCFVGRWTSLSLAAAASSVDPIRRSLQVFDVVVRPHSRARAHLSPFFPTLRLSSTPIILTLIFSLK